jgi:hypothetical protein
MHLENGQRVKSPEESMLLDGERLKDLQEDMSKILSPEEFIKKYLGEKPKEFIYNQVVKEEDFKQEPIKTPLSNRSQRSKTPVSQRSIHSTTRR